MQKTVDRSGRYCDILTAMQQINLRDILFSMMLLTLSACGNFYETDSCQKDCHEKYNFCILIGGAFSTSPAGHDANPLLLFLSCESTRTVCEDTCGGTSRL